MLIYAKLTSRCSCCKKCFAQLEAAVNSCCCNGFPDRSGAVVDPAPLRQSVMVKPPASSRQVCSIIKWEAGRISGVLVATDFASTVRPAAGKRDGRVTERQSEGSVCHKAVTSHEALEDSSAHSPSRSAQLGIEVTAVDTQHRTISDSSAT